MSFYLLTLANTGYPVLAGVNAPAPGTRCTHTRSVGSIRAPTRLSSVTVPPVRILLLALPDVVLHVLVALDEVAAARASRYGLVVLPLVHLELVRVREGLVGVGPVAARVVTPLGGGVHPALVQEGRFRYGYYRHRSRWGHCSRCLTFRFAFVVPRHEGWVTIGAAEGHWSVALITLRLLVRVGARELDVVHLLAANAVVQALAEDAFLLSYAQVGPIVVVADVPAPQVWGAAICMVGLAARPR